VVQDVQVKRESTEEGAKSPGGGRAAKEAGANAEGIVRKGKEEPRGQGVPARLQHRGNVGRDWADGEVQ